MFKLQIFVVALFVAIAHTTAIGKLGQPCTPAGDECYEYSGVCYCPNPPYEGDCFCGPSDARAEIDARQLSPPTPYTPTSLPVTPTTAPIQPSDVPCPPVPTPSPAA